MVNEHHAENQYMSQFNRLFLCGAILATGIVAQAALEKLNHTVRPALRMPLKSIPFDFCGWTGRDVTIDPDIIERAQTTEYINRTYDNRTRSGLSFSVWINYSRIGDNLRHTPEICLPSGGWTKIESQTRLLSVPSLKNRAISITRLSYAKGELVEHVGFWYYIFGEGKLENYARHLPITSQSSYGRTTRGSSMTVEVFDSGDNDPEGESLRDFVRELLAALERILPLERADYHIP
jgi:Protein of unknown function (DUF3485)